MEGKSRDLRGKEKKENRSLKSESAERGGGNEGVNNAASGQSTFTSRKFHFKLLSFL